MAKTKLLLTIAGEKVTLERPRKEKGYYIGEINVNGTFFHVEAISVYTDGNAINNLYQNRIDRWLETNESMDYARVLIDGGEYFVNIEAYAR